MSDAVNRGDGTRLLRDALGPDADFRSGQWEAIDAIINARKRILVVQRTGFGKSIVYFLATRLLRRRQEGITLIVSPLISLMRNQIDHAMRFGVRAVTINSSNSDEWLQHFEVKAIDSGDVDAILVSPERLANEDFINRIFVSPTANKVGLLVVDEAHCISVWGHDFRPDYRRLIDTVAKLPVTLRVLGTTATATGRVADDIRQILGDDVVVQRGSLLRETLHLQNISMPDHPSRLAWLAENVPGLPGSGIVYVLRKLDADQITEWLRSKGIDARAYYSGVAPSRDFPHEFREFAGRVDEYRQYLEQLLIDNKIKVLVATIALGMGFDKSDIGFVVHYQTPGSIVAYYQMVGRAGRATSKAYGILMSAEEDFDVQKHFWDTAFPTQEDIDDILEALVQHRHDGLTTEELEIFVNIRPRDIVKTVRHLSTRDPDPPIVQISGTSKWTVNGSSWRNFQLDDDLIQRVREQRQAEWTDMINYTKCTDKCLMTLLRSMLDDVTLLPDQSDRCGKCSNCAGRPIVAVKVDRRLAQESVVYLKRTPRFFTCKVDVPKFFEFRRSGLDLPNDASTDDLTMSRQIPTDLRPEDGLALCNWMDAGWGMKVHDDKKVKSLSDELVVALADAITRWEPWKPRKNYGWVTCVPSKMHQKLVPDFAYRLAGRLNLPFRKIVVHKEDNHKAQKSRNNNYHRCDNLDGTFKIKEQTKLFRGPVLLVDDIVRSTWTVTVIAALLRQAGSGPVFPVTLARIGTED